MIKPHCIYSNAEFVISKCLRNTIFDSVLLSSWRCAEKENALNYKIKECDVHSKSVKVDNCDFIVALNEKRFSNRRAPQEMTSINQPFDNAKFNFTKVKEKEILMTIGKKGDSIQDANVIIVNASPFQEGHSLLVPELSLCHNQVMRERPLRTALDTILVSGEPYFTVAFNSMLACASVNHLHFHLWVNETPLVSSLLTLEPRMYTSGGQTVWHMPDHPIYNLVVTFTDISTLDRDFRLFWGIVSTLQKLEIPHSICYLRSDEGLRGVVWPRQIEADYGLKMGLGPSCGVINVAAAELAGQIFTGDKELFYNHIDSELLERSFRRINLSERDWAEVLTAIQKNINNYQ